jgi:hypothetical protein
MDLNVKLHAIVSFISYSKFWLLFGEVQPCRTNPPPTEILKGLLDIVILKEQLLAGVSGRKKYASGNTCYCT